MHALNCLRLLFNSSTLGAHMLQWVEQGLMCSFQGFRCVTVWGCLNPLLVVVQVRGDDGNNNDNDAPSIHTRVITLTLTQVLLLARA